MGVGSSDMSNQLLLIHLGHWQVDSRTSVLGGMMDTLKLVFAMFVAHCIGHSGPMIPPGGCESTGLVREVLCLEKWAVKNGLSWSIFASKFYAKKLCQNMKIFSFHVELCDLLIFAFQFDSMCSLIIAR